MKSNYILDNFESLVCEIKDSKFSLDQESKDSSHGYTFENFTLYSISFQDENGKINYKISNPSNSIHPCTVEYKYYSDAAPHNYIPLINQIVFELQIKSLSKEYHWKNNNDKIQLYIKANPKLEKETKEIRFFNYCYNILKNENDIIESFIKTKVLKCKTSEQTTQFIHKNQYALDKFTSRLIKRINPKSVDDLYCISENYDRIDCLKLTFSFAERLLAFLESDYFSFLNPTIRASDNTILKAQNNLAYKSEYIKSKINSADIDKKLSKIALNPIQKLEDCNVNKPITCNEYKYCSRFISKAFKMLKENKAELSNKTLSDWLSKTNLNTLSFFDYLTDTIIKELEQCDTNTQGLEILFKMLKVQNQNPNSVNRRFKLKLPAIKQQLVNWLEEEAEYVRKKINLEGQNPKFESSENKIKLLSGLSVAQLSYFSNLLLQTNIIKHDNQSEVFRFMADNFKTTMTDKISKESFRTKYYNVEDSTKNIVREKIIDLLNLTKL
ncbi:MAG: hypothetical protein H7339_16975 [Arcicella sp.]|nr:hypothetical protein [Arcicella sp.]